MTKRRAEARLFVGKMCFDYGFGVIVGDGVIGISGEIVGDGETLGETVGDGEPVGLTLGETVGEIVGEIVGETVGALFIRPFFSGATAAAKIPDKRNKHVPAAKIVFLNIN
jgi:hypothetical protein